MRRPYIAESVINPGTGVVQGSSERKVKAPGSEGSGDFIGVYPFEANEAKEVGDPIGIVISGVAKVLAGGNLTAGKHGVLKGDTSGSFISLPAAVGQYAVCGIFLEDGTAGEYVDMLIEHGRVTIPAAG
jgi:hypothetical protein